MDAGIASRLRAAGYELPAASAAIGDYVPAVRCGDTVFTSGQLPIVGGVLVAEGTVGRTVTIETARECAETAALNALAAAATVCDLDQVERVVKVVGYVNSVEGFKEQPSVVNGASAVMIAAYGEAGRHAREAVGVASLPLGAPVEVSLILALKCAS